MKIGQKKGVSESASKQPCQYRSDQQIKHFAGEPTLGRNRQVTATFGYGAPHPSTRGDFNPPDLGAAQRALSKRYDALPPATLAIRRRAGAVS
jgi:hypothetical protein